jgi:hypothetical protein
MDIVQEDYAKAIGDLEQNVTIATRGRSRILGCCSDRPLQFGRSVTLILTAERASNRDAYT